MLLLTTIPSEQVLLIAAGWDVGVELIKSPDRAMRSPAIY